MTARDHDPRDRRDDRRHIRTGDRDRGRGAKPPELPDDVRAGELDHAVREEFRTLAKPVADTVARHLVAAGRLVDEEPQQALDHAVAARRLASRIAAVREAVGVTAYAAGQWQTAVAELRTYQRMSGRSGHVAMLADCERALGRPERALELYRTASRDGLARAEALELLIVAAGARADLGQPETALTMLHVPELTQDAPWVARLRYAYADALLRAGREDEAREWFARAAEADEDTETDAVERLLELEGVEVTEVTEVTEGTAQDAGAEEPAGGAAADPTAGGVGPEDRPDPSAGQRLVDAYDVVVLDLDGVVYVGEDPVPAAAEVVAQLRQEGRTLVFATNNASRSADEVAALLTRLGVPAAPDEILTSAMAAADHLAGKLEPGAAVLILGAEALAQEVHRVGLRPVHQAAEDTAAVVQGYARHLGWAHLAEACVAVRSGAWWVVTNPDTTLPSHRGNLPGNGAMAAALATALGRGPDLVIGKPEPALFDNALGRARSPRALVVGDRLDTDIEGARRAGTDSLLVLTGVDGEAEVAAVPADRRPTYVGKDLTVLLEPAGDGRPS